MQESSQPIEALRTTGLAIGGAIGRLIARVGVLLAIVGFLLPLAGCSDDWNQNSPEGTIRTARILVEKGRARELHKLIYPESPEMTEFLRKTGVLLGNMEKLARQVQKSLPKEVEELKAKGLDAAQSGKAAEVLSQIANQQRRRRRGAPDFKESDARQEAIQRFAETLFADPYASLREGEARLSTSYLTDDTVSLRWDGDPIMPPLGLQMKRDEASGLWYFKLPTNIPVLSQYLPRNAKEWKIAEYGVVVLNNTLVDLRKDLEAGRLTSLDQLSKSAVEKTVPPIIMIGVAYAKMIDDRKAAQPK